jgi:hypothetical protein
MHGAIDRAHTALPELFINAIFLIEHLTDQAGQSFHFTSDHLTLRALAYSEVFFKLKETRISECWLSSKTTSTLEWHTAGYIEK